MTEQNRYWTEKTLFTAEINYRTKFAEQKQNLLRWDVVRVFVSTEYWIQLASYSDLNYKKSFHILHVSLFLVEFLLLIANRFLDGSLADTGSSLALLILH